jgi:hypothetical protein
LPAFGDTGVHEATGRLVTLLNVQVVVVKALAGAPMAGEQVATGTFAVVAGLQVMAV